MSVEALPQVYRYHDETKHHVGRYARSLGYLDWASQPRPFRAFEGAPTVQLFPGPLAPGATAEDPRGTYDQLFGDPVTATHLTAEAVGDFLRHALGLSAWKVFQRSRWSLRVNPSSGNLHPTEAYLVGTLPGIAASPGVWHYAPDRHLLEQRCAFGAGSRSAARDHVATSPAATGAAAFLVALTSIHWREAWKYGERAFRYCQHDLGHAIAALGFAAGMRGWRLTMLPEWPQRDIATLVGLDRDEDYFEAEREEPACLLAVTSTPGLPAESRELTADSLLLDAVRRGRWFGKASQLSEDHVEWTFIDEVARATEDAGRSRARSDEPFAPGSGAARPPGGASGSRADRGIDARTLVVQRRSAVALDGVSSIDRAQFLQMIRRVMPRSTTPYNAIWWPPCIHLAIFVHRVNGVAPGLYLLARTDEAVPRLRAACARDFLWQPVETDLPLWLLEAGDYRTRSKQVSCDQDIAADGFFSLGMIADFDASLSLHGPSFYRHLFWESGVVGQVLYLEAEAAGARATGIGCFFDDAVHELLGLEGHAFQSLYHFTVGAAVEDTRLTTEPGYAWEI